MVYRELEAQALAEGDFNQFLTELFNSLTDGRRDPNDVVRDTLCQIHFGSAPVDSLPLAARALAHSFDPRNATTEPEYYSEIDTDLYLTRKPYIWLWQMFDQTPLGRNALFGHRFRRMLAPLIFRRVGENFRCWQYVEWSFGYNLSIGDNVVIHRHVLLDDRGGIEIGNNVSISDYANIYSHTHDVDDIYKVTNLLTRIGEGARITYHATVLAGVQMGAHSMLGTGAVATSDVEPYHVKVGVPAKTVKVKSMKTAKVAE
jgi:acetyltransferase-like isoleucine patch superfamily enzyme